MDAVWRKLERGIGIRVPWQHMQMSDPRCNRSCHGVFVGGRWTPVLDDTDPRGLRARDLFMEAFGSMDFDRRPWIVAVATAP